MLPTNTCSLQGVGFRRIFRPSDSEKLQKILLIGFSLENVCYKDLHFAVKFH